MWFKRLNEKLSNLETLASWESWDTFSVYNHEFGCALRNLLPSSLCVTMFLNRGRELDGPGVTLDKGDTRRHQCPIGGHTFGQPQGFWEVSLLAGLRSHREGKGSEEGTNRKGIPLFCVLGLFTEAPAFKHTLTVQHHVCFELGVQSNVACGWR